jgi:hypothetical protein
VHQPKALSRSQAAAIDPSLSLSSTAKDSIHLLCKKPPMPCYGRPSSFRALPTKSCSHHKFHGTHPRESEMCLSDSLCSSWTLVRSSHTKERERAGQEMSAQHSTRSMPRKKRTWVVLGNSTYLDPGTTLCLRRNLLAFQHSSSSCMGSWHQSRRQVSLDHRGRECHELNQCPITQILRKPICPCKKPSGRLPASRSILLTPAIRSTQESSSRGLKLRTYDLPAGNLVLRESLQGDLATNSIPPVVLSAMYALHA